MARKTVVQCLLFIANWTFPWSSKFLACSEMFCQYLTSFWDFREMSFEFLANFWDFLRCIANFWLISGIFWAVFKFLGFSEITCKFRLSFWRNLASSCKSWSQKPANFFQFLSEVSIRVRREKIFPCVDSMEIYLSGATYLGWAFMISCNVLTWVRL